MAAFVTSDWPTKRRQCERLKSKTLCAKVNFLPNCLSVFSNFCAKATLKIVLGLLRLSRFSGCTQLSWQNRERRSRQICSHIWDRIDRLSQ